MRTVCVLLIAFLAAISAFSQTNPVPSISQPLVPGQAIPGSAALTLTVNGSGFVAGSVVRWNGNARSTTFKSAAQLTAAIPASDLVNPSTAIVSVMNPPPGGGISNGILFETTKSSTAVTFSQTEIPLAQNIVLLATADFNGDGKSDLVIAVSNGISILLGNGDGTFRSPVHYSINFGGSTGVADVNGDGNLDLIFTSGAVLLGNGDGTF
jgi:hypothetical protein